MICFASVCVRVRVCSVAYNFVSPWTVACQAPLAMGFSRQNTGVCCHFLPQIVCHILSQNDFEGEMIETAWLWKGLFILGSNRFVDVIQTKNMSPSLILPRSSKCWMSRYMEPILTNTLDLPVFFETWNPLKINPQGNVVNIWFDLSAQPNGLRGK